MCTAVHLCVTALLCSPLHPWVTAEDAAPCLPLQVGRGVLRWRSEAPGSSRQLRGCVCACVCVCRCCCRCFLIVVVVVAAAASVMRLFSSLSSRQDSQVLERDGPSAVCGVACASRHQTLRMTPCPHNPFWLSSTHFGFRQPISAFVNPFWLLR